MKENIMKLSLEEHARLAADGDKESLELLVHRIQDDVYGLSLRMLGVPADAQDATQEILIKVITHVGSYRGESAFRTWVWKVATHHLLRVRRGRYESTIDFSSIEAMIDAGTGLPSASVEEADVQRLAEEVRLGCTHAMLVALDRDHRITYILGDVLGFTSDDAAQILEIDAATFRKRLQRARERLGGFMQRKCGLVDPVAACRCVRQIPVLEERGLLDPKRLTYSDHPRRRAEAPSVERAWEELSSLDAVTRMMRDRPDYAAPEALSTKIRELFDSKQFQVLQ
jgi:RNA polymerase sigma factor (sigma-70 family)